ncbi:MAG: arsenate reductase ArsC [Candidatus Omnitrophota bacterium]|nr:MAG: arsenate reductase ArsC [Candidatus Omnitrophota bacterium]
MKKKQKVLILCTHNSVRSQMAEGILRHLAPEKFEVESAGTCPCGVNPYAIKALDEIGIDISQQYSKDISDFAGRHFDYVITVCRGVQQACPVFTGNCKRIHWPLEDPGNVKGTTEEILRVFRNTRNILKALLLDFIGGSLGQAHLKCPFCKNIQKIEVPQGKCLLFYKCRNCGKIIPTPGGNCCTVCGYSDKVCKAFYAQVKRTFSRGGGV